MAIGRTFKEAFQKGVRSLEIGRYGLGADGRDPVNHIDAGDDQTAVLTRNGFVVAPAPYAGFSALYADSEVAPTAYPSYITVDSVLHVTQLALDRAWRAVAREQVAAELAHHPVDVIGISAGFDNHVDDWGGLLLTEDYFEIGRLVRGASQKNGGGGFAILEGGYNARYVPSGHLVFVRSGGLFAVPFDLDSLEDEGASAEKVMAEAEAALAAVSDQLDKTEFYSPMDGVVTRLNVEEGENVVTGTMNAPGTVIMTISDLASMEVEVEIDETDIVDVEIGQHAIDPGKELRRHDLPPVIIGSKIPMLL